VALLTGIAIEFRRVGGAQLAALLEIFGGGDAGIQVPGYATPLRSRGQAAVLARHILEAELTAGVHGWPGAKWTGRFGLRVRAEHSDGYNQAHPMQRPLFHALKTSAVGPRLARASPVF